VPTNRERLLAAIQACPGLTDAELCRLTGIEPHQQVNQICRALAARGLIRRVTGPGGQIVNLPSDGTTALASPEKPATAKGQASPASLRPEGALVVLPCSARKASGGGTRSGTRRVVAFCARTSSYAELLRRVDWPPARIDAYLAAPALGGRGGTQVLVPRASCEALATFLAGGLPADWQSSDRVGLVVTFLR
jgi:hypothetical protein